MATNTRDMCKDLMRDCKDLEDDIDWIIANRLPKGHSFAVYLNEARAKIRLVDNMAYYVVSETEGEKR